MLLQLGLAYGPAFLLFFCTLFFSTTGSRKSLWVAAAALIVGFLIIQQTAFPVPQKGFLNWFPWMVLLFAVVGTLPRKIAKWASLVVCVLAASILINKVFSVNPRWTAIDQWLNGSLLMVLPILMGWYALSRERQKAELPIFFFGITGLIVLLSIICYLVAGTSKTALFLGSVGILCAAGFVVSSIKRNRAAIHSLSLMFFAVSWLCTSYVHYFTENLPVWVTTFILVAQPLTSWFDLSNRSTKWKVIIPLLVVILGGLAVASVFQANASSPDDYGY